MKSAGELIREARGRAGLTQTELARRAETSQPTIAAYESGMKTPALDTLERVLDAAGYALETSIRRAPKPGELRRLIDEHREEIIAIAARHKAHNVRIFGSVARGDDHSSSDADFLVDLQQGASLLDLAGLHDDISELLGIDVDIVSSGGLRERFRERVLSEAAPV